MRDRPALRTLQNRRRPATVGAVSIQRV